jgi:PTS system nitrogen regulatory IIA component
MELSDILTNDSVKVVASLSSKKRLFLDLGDIAEAEFGMDRESTVEALLERESLGPTAVGHGVALPHARMPGLDRVCGAFVRLEKPLEFDAADRQPVDLVFALFAPEDAGVEHLKALALVSRTMRSADVCAKLRSNSTASTLHTILTELPANRAA